MANGAPTIRGLAAELGAEIDRRLGRADAAAAAPAGWSWPAWSADLLTIWLHVPKTAGTTLWDILERNFGKFAFPAMQRGAETDSALGLQRPKIIGELWQSFPETERARFKFAGGHLPYGVDEVFGQPCQYFTFLRHPIEQAVSLYYFWVEVGLIGVEEATQPGRLSLDRAVDEGIFLALHNYQTRVLSGLPELDPAFSRFPSKQQLEVPDEALRLAMRHVDEMFFVGLSERFDISVIILAQLCGWRLDDLLSTRKKVNPLRPKTISLPESLRRQLAEITALDRKLYAHAKARFHRQAKLCHRQIAAYLPVLRDLNGLGEAAGSFDAPILPAQELAVRAVAARPVEPPAWPQPEAAPSGGEARSLPPFSEPLLDRIPGAGAAFGLRLLRRGHPRPVLQVRRLSDGHAEAFGAGRDGRLPGQAIEALLAGSEGAVAIWYDQAGAHDARAVEAEPAYRLSSGEHGPIVGFGPPATMECPVTLFGAAGFSIFACFRPVSVEDGQSVARWDEPGGAFVCFPDRLGNVLVGNAQRAVSLPLGIAPRQFAVYGIVCGAADGRLTAYRSGAAVASAMAPEILHAVSQSGAPLFIGSDRGIADYFTGALAELIVWPRALSAAEVAVVCADMMTVLPADR